MYYVSLHRFWHKPLNICSSNILLVCFSIWLLACFFPRQTLLCFLSFCECPMARYLPDMENVPSRLRSKSVRRERSNVASYLAELANQNETTFKNCCRWGLPEKLVKFGSVSRRIEDKQHIFNCAYGWIFWWLSSLFFIACSTKGKTNMEDFFKTRVGRKAKKKTGFELFEMLFFNSGYAGCCSVSFRFRFKLDGGASKAEIEHTKDLKWYYDQKSFPFFLPSLKAYSLNIQLVKFWALTVLSEGCLFWL